MLWGSPGVPSHSCHALWAAEPLPALSSLQAQQEISEGAGERRRAHQPRSLAVVLPRGGRREVSHRGHVLADRDSESSPGCSWDLSVPCAPRRVSVQVCSGISLVLCGLVTFRAQEILLWPGRVGSPSPFYFLDLKQAPRRDLLLQRVPSRLALDPALLPLFLSPSSSKASCPNTGPLSPAVSFPRPHAAACICLWDVL